MVKGLIFNYLAPTPWERLTHAISSAGIRLTFGRHSIDIRQTFGRHSAGIRQAFGRHFEAFVEGGGGMEGGKI